MRRRWWAGLLALAVLAGTLSSARAGGPAVVSHDFTVTSTLDGTSLVARYYRPAAPGDYPVVLAPHGGGGTVDSEAPRAQRYAAAGFVAVVWSARGHGSSGGLYDLFGQKTVQDTEDVLQWVIAHRAQTAADPDRVGAVGYSQGGGTANLIGVRDPRVKVLAPGQTFAGLSESLHPNGCTKLSVASTILGAAYTAQGARLDPTLVVPWSAYLATGVGGDATEAQWTVRSPETYAYRTTQPTLWVQAFDDPLFPIDQALKMQRLRRGSDFRLWLSWGGHFAAATSDVELAARENAWQGWLEHVLQGKDTPAAHLPRVTWWYRAADGRTLVRRSSPSWPPPGVRSTSLPVPTGSVLALGRGVADDPIVRWGERTLGTPDQVGQTVSAVPATSGADTLVTTGSPLKARTLLAGAPRADIVWSSTAADSQLDVKLYDVAPDGSGTLLSYGCTSVRGAGPHRVRLDLMHTAIEVPAGHRLEVWVQGSDAPTWLPAQQPAVDTIGAGSRVLVPVLPGARHR